MDHPVQDERRPRPSGGRARDRRSRERGLQIRARGRAETDRLRPAPPGSRGPCPGVEPRRYHPREPRLRWPAGETPVSAVTQRGRRRRGDVSLERVDSGDLPGKSSAERDPEWIAVRGLEGPALIPTSLAPLCEMADVFCEHSFLLQASDDVRYNVRLDRDHEGPFADRV